MRTMHSLGAARSLMSVLREISFDEIRADAERSPKLLVLADRSEDGRSVAENLSGEVRSQYVSVATTSSEIGDFSIYDAVIVFDPEARQSTRELIDQIAVRTPATPFVPFLSRDPSDTEAAFDVRDRILSRLPGHAPALGRHLPAFRSQSVNIVIDETAIANGQFALLANLPAIVPFFGSLATATADFLVLTKNQLLLVFKIAAIYGEDLHDKITIAKEMAPVAGAGFFWRTLAREASAFLPLAAGAIPRVAIAYSGTVAVGRAAEHYYRLGEKPSKEMMRSFYRTGMESLKRRELPFAPRKDTVEADFRVVDGESEDRSA